MSDVWSNSTVAANLLKVEQAKLAMSLPNLHGHYLLQYSGWNKKAICSTSLQYDFFVTSDCSGGAQVDFLQLPFREHSMDCVVMHHVLERTENPHQALREGASTVVPNGYIVIVGFNPWSLWGVSRYVPKNKGPSDGRYISASRVADWLNLLGYRIEQLEQTQFLPPFACEMMPGFSNKVDMFANWLGVSGGGVYILVARKLVAGRMPIRPQWKTLTGRRLPVATPTARGMRVSNR